MAITLDNLATRYNILPSEALVRATTLDLYVLDASARWSRYQQGVANGMPEESVPRPSTEEMIKMMAQVKGM